MRSFRIFLFRFIFSSSPHRISRGEAVNIEIKQNFHAVTLREDGTVLVRASFHYPTSEAWTLYAELAKNAEEWLRTVLMPKATEEFQKDSSPKKHFFFPAYDYRFEVREVSQDKESVTFSLTVTLVRGKNKELLDQKEFTDRFRLPDLAMLPSQRKSHRR